MPKNGGISRERRRFMKGKSEWPSSCSQDIIYPALVGTAQWFSGSVVAVGDSSAEYKHLYIA